MKTIIANPLITIAFILLSFSSNAKWVQLKLKPNDVFIYEWRSNFATLSSNAIRPEGNRHIRFSLKIDSIAKKKIVFTARVLFNVNDITQKHWTYYTDYGFPQLVKYYQEGNLTDILEETLFQIPFRFELNRTKHSISLANQDEIISRSEDILKSRHYTNKQIEEVRASLKYNVLYNKTKFFLMPFRYIRTNLDIQDTLTDYKNKILVQNTGNGILEVNGVPNDKISYLNYKIDLQYGLITSSLKREKLSFEEANRIIQASPSGKIEPEERLALIEKTTVKPQKIIVCGHIENPVSSKALLCTQTNIFGSEFDSKSAQLDKSGNFRFEFKLQENGLITLMNPNNNHFYNDVPILLYASPGDSIYVNFSLKNKEYLISSLDPGNPDAKIVDKYTVPESIAFSGDRSKEAQVLYHFQNLKGLPHVWSGRISRVDCKVYMDALSELNSLIKPLTEDKSCTESASYLQKELQAYLYSNLFNARVEDPGSYWARIYYGPVISANMKKLVYDQLDTLNIHRIYNDYGIFSRSLTQSYFRYKKHRLTNNNMIINLFKPETVHDPELNFQLCKMILYGSPLYREAASQLYSYLVSANPDSKTGNQWQGEINEMFGLMLERCNDATFSHSLSEIVENCNKWKKINIYPISNF